MLFRSLFQMPDDRHGLFRRKTCMFARRAAALPHILRAVKHFLDLLDEFNRLNIEFVSFREQIDTGGPLGRAIVVIIGAIAELESIVKKLEEGDLPLEQSLALYERGVQLSRFCHARLEEAERRIELLNERGELKPAPPSLAGDD